MEIVLQGASMGGATVFMLCGVALPDNLIVKTASESAFKLSINRVADQRDF